MVKRGMRVVGLHRGVRERGRIVRSHGSVLQVRITGGRVVWMRRATMEMVDAPQDARARTAEARDVA